MEVDHTYEITRCVHGGMVGNGAGAGLGRVLEGADFLVEYVEAHVVHHGGPEHRGVGGDHVGVKVCETF